MLSETVQVKVIEDDPDMLHFKYSYNYKKCKFKTTNTNDFEMNRTSKRQMCNSHKGITSVKKTDLLRIYKKGLILKQDSTIFNSPTVTTSAERKMILILTVIVRVKR